MYKKQVIKKMNTNLQKLFLLAAFVCGSFQTNGQIFTESNLPIVIIVTDNDIQNDPRVFGTMKIIQRPDGSMNQVADADTDLYLNYSGTISIETRGSSSQVLDKKPYGFSTLSDDRVKNVNVKLLGMSKENDWILNSFAFDPSMMRDYISYEMARKMGLYAVSLKYCELVVNGNYRGIYALSEKIKIDENRLNISKIKRDDTEGTKLTGGYLIQQDRSVDGRHDFQNYIIEKPERGEITSEQKEYITDVFSGLDNSAGNPDISNGYPSVIDVPTFIDYMLMAEISSNADAYALSTFFHKDKGGKLRAGPVWDYNLTFGNDLFYLFGGFDRSKTDVWQFKYENKGAGFWQTLFEEPTFNCYLSTRFEALTQSGAPFNSEYIDDLIDSTVLLISPAVTRNNERWGLSEEAAFESNITEMKTWIQNRITWMRINFKEEEPYESPWTDGAGGESITSVATENDNTYYSMDVTATVNPYDINLSQKVAIISNKSYRLVFNAWSDRNRTIIAGIGLSEHPWLTNIEEVAITTNSNSVYSLLLSANDFGAINARVLFDLGAEDGLVNIDNVSLKIQSELDSTLGSELLTNGNFENEEEEEEEEEDSCNISVEIPSLVITKIHYNPMETETFTDSDDLEFIEIQNTGDTEINLTGIYFSKLGMSYQFPQGSTIAAGASISLAGDRSTFEEKYGVAPFGKFSRTLSNKSHHLVLVDAFGNVIDEVAYSDEAPWPTSADGEGNLLELTDVTSDNALAINWIAVSDEVLSTNRFVNNEAEYTLYPNPTAGTLFIKGDKTPLEVSIYTVLGKKVHTAKNTNNIDIKALPSGVYTIKISDGMRQVNSKFIKK